MHVAELRSDRHCRWLTARETLLCQGFPILNVFSGGVSVCSFALDGFDDDTYSEDNSWLSDTIRATSDRTAHAGQAGNAMHCEAVGICLAYVIICGSRKETSTSTTSTQLPRAPSALSVASSSDAKSGTDSAGGSSAKPDHSVIKPKATHSVTTMTTHTPQAKPTNHGLTAGLANLARMISGSKRR